MVPVLVPILSSKTVILQTGVLIVIFVSKVGKNKYQNVSK